jgi:hypothetical protein
MKEKMSEIELMINTLKMYDNTIDQMEKNGISEDSINKVREERENVALEFKAIVDRNTKEIERENQFVKKALEKEKEKKFEYERPKYADIQDKISNSKWISSSNFIFRFPKDEINIDEWRVASFSYLLSGPKSSCSCNPWDGTDEDDSDNVGGNLYVQVNDFSEKINDYKYNILANIYLELLKNPIIIGNICVDVIDNGGDLLYTIVFEKCRFTGNGGGSISMFDYGSTALNKMNFAFTFKNILFLAPNEDLGPADETTY